MRVAPPLEPRLALLLPDAGEDGQGEAHAVGWDIGHGVLRARAGVASGLGLVEGPEAG